MKRLLEIAGVLCLGAALFGAIFFFYWLAPYRHLALPSWRAQHTDRAIWDETRRSIARIGWTHDDLLTVGAFGDRSWAARLIQEIAEGSPVDDMVIHRGTALEKITNQGFGNDAKAWLTWWQENGHRAQEDWIRDGFARGGLQLGEELTVAEATALLRVLGSTERQPPGWHWNAFRWLRDSGFRPWNVCQLDQLTGQDREAVTRGLERFLVRYGASPPSHYAGRLDLGGEVPPRPPGPPEGQVIALPETARKVAAGLALLAALGAILVWRSRR